MPELTTEDAPASTGTSPCPPFEVLLYYLYFPIEDPEDYVEEHRALCEKLELRGRILVAREGINGTLSGRTEDTQRYREWMQAQPASSAITFKADPADGHAFRKLAIKARREIVTLGLPSEEDLDPNETTGRYLSPQEFYDAMQDPDAVILDARNDYESELGKFRNAICPEVANFREFPQWIRQHRDLLEGKRILTYCTGGIRCEKFSGFLVNEGFDNVSQLEGGIVTYGRDPAVQGKDFEGSCYVFDERISVPVNHVNPSVIAHCQHCGTPSERYRNCAYAPCNAQFFCCPACEESFGKFCRTSCRDQAAEISSPDGGGQ